MFALGIVANPPKSSTLSTAFSVPPRLYALEMTQLVLSLRGTLSSSMSRRSLSQFLTSCFRRSSAFLGQLSIVVGMPHKL
jgi:hypothetical protein